jgi:acetolactate decarboxylase
MTNIPTKLLATILPVYLLLGCSGGDEAKPLVKLHSDEDGVQVHGALRAMFHQGRTDTMVTLDTLLPNPNLYAVGALTDLSGEITIIAGRTVLSFPDGDTTRAEIPAAPKAAATLLVSADVPAWQSVTTEQPISFEEIDDALGQLAAAAGMNLDTRFPFLLEGKFENLQWHVIDGTRLAKDAKSHKDHLAAAVQVQQDLAKASLIGFYSKSDQGVFTHMGSKTHIHCVTGEPNTTGHVDHVIIPAGTTVKFPAVSSNHASLAEGRYVNKHTLPDGTIRTDPDP